MKIIDTVISFCNKKAFKIGCIVVACLAGLLAIYSFVKTPFTGDIKVFMAAANQAYVFIAPAMNTNMYENPIVQENMEKLRGLGYQIIEPKEAMLACGTMGKGALADVEEIVRIVETVGGIKNL